MTTNANAQSETLLPRDVLGPATARWGTSCASRTRLPPSDTSTIEFTRIDALGIYGVMVRNTFARSTLGEGMERKGHYCPSIHHRTMQCLSRVRCLGSGELTSISESAERPQGFSMPASGIPDSVHV